MMLKACGWWYLCLSFWAIIQLVIMGMMYRLESLGLIEDCEAHVFVGIKDFIEKTRENFKTVANNCFIAAAIYLVILGLALLCIYFGNMQEARARELLLDDELACAVVHVPLTAKQLKKIT